MCLKCLYFNVFNNFFSARSSSQATLDSLEMTRYSEDGDKTVNERVAILEFELRKAKDTINALRTNLTVAAVGNIVLNFKINIAVFLHIL